MKISQNKFLSHMSYSLLLPIVRFSYGFLLAIILSKNLSVEAYGEWSLFIGMIGMVLTFSSLNLMYSTQVIFPTKSKLELRDEIVSVSSFKIIFTIVVAILFCIYAYSVELFNDKLLYVFILFIIFRTVGDLIFGLLRALLRVKEQVKFLFLESYLILLLVFFAVIINTNVQTAIYAFLIAEVIACIYGTYLLREYIQIPSIKFEQLKPYFIIGIPLVPFAFMDLIINAMTPLFIKLYISIDKVAIYSIAQKVAMLITIPSVVLNNIYTQYLSKAYENSKDDMLKVLKKFLLLYTVSLSIVSVFLYLFGEHIIVIISSKEYIQSFDTMILLIIANIAVIFSSLFTSIFAVMKKTKKISFIWISVLVLYIVLSIILSQSFGLNGSVYAILVSFSIGFLSVAYYAMKEIRKLYE